LLHQHYSYSYSQTIETMDCIGILLSTLQKTIMIVLCLRHAVKVNVHESDMQVMKVDDIDHCFCWVKLRSHKKQQKKRQRLFHLLTMIRSFYNKNKVVTHSSNSSFIPRISKTEKKTRRCQIDILIENICHFAPSFKRVMSAANIYTVNIHLSSILIINTFWSTDLWHWNLPRDFFLYNKYAWFRLIEKKKRNFCFFRLIKK